MSLCPYCGRETNSDGFICADCSKPDQSPILKIESKAPIKLTEPPTKPQPIAKYTEQRNEPLEKEPQSKPVSLNYSNQELHGDFAALNRIAMLVLVLTPLALLATLPAIGLSSIWSFLLFFAIANFCGFGMLNYFTRKNRFKFLSWVKENTEPTELYFYTRKSTTNDLVYHPVIYDEDEMFPEYSSMRNITIEQGCLELCGWDKKRPDALIPALAYYYNQSGHKAVIFECKGNRLWCRFE